MNSLDRQRAGMVVCRRGWLAETPRSFQELLLARCEVVRLRATQNVYAAGDDPGGLFGVIEGRLEVHMPRTGVDSTLAYVAGAGFWIGDAAAVRGHPRLVSVVAGTRCRLLRLTRTELQRLASEDPATWRYVAALLARTVALAVNLIDALKRDEPLLRIAAVLVSLLEEPSAECGVLAISQSDLGAIAHLGRGSVNGALRELEGRGLIRRGYGAVELLRTSALRQLAGRLAPGVRAPARLTA